jgi:molybdenum cofactor cytidylyltransferase
VIWAVVLAAGESRRMGTQKLLLPFRETTVVEAVVRTALASRVGRALAVLGADRDAIRAKLEPCGVDIAINEDFARGMLSSVQAGFRALPADAEAAVVMLGDQPFLPARVIDAVVRAYEESRKGIVIPVHKGRRGHPVLVDLKYRDEVLGLDPADGLRQLIRAHPDDILEVEVGCADILRDMDTPEDYEDGEDRVKPTAGSGGERSPRSDLQNSGGAARSRYSDRYLKRARKGRPA